MRFIALALLLLSQGCAAATTTSRPPANILLILLDDAGYSDVAGFAGSRAPTPNLQRLASEGVRFTRFYADSTCQTARLSLLTGQQSSRVVMAPDFAGISPEVDTLPEKLQQAGYATWHIGKWHLGETTRHALPSAQGFDHWYGFLSQFLLRGLGPEGEIRYRRPTYDNPWLQRDDAGPQQQRGHLEDILADEVVRTIDQAAKGGKPWYINYWTFAPHHPSSASEKYRKQFPDTPEGKYFALLKQLDDNIGRVLQALEASGQQDNTIVLVLSDNGGTNEHVHNNGPYAGVKGMYSEGGTRVPMILRWPDHVRAGTSYDGIAAIYDVMPTLMAQAGLSAGKTDGINLLPLLEKNTPRPVQPLFWETATAVTYQYSMLSADGRWRLDDDRLFDLQKDPFAQADVARKYPDKYRELKQQFLRWRREVHRLDLPTETLAEGRAWRITGDRLRRSPGDGALTLLTSLRPAKGEQAQGTIAEQQGMWSMELLPDQRIRLRVNGEERLSKPLSLLGCTPLLLSLHYSRSGVQPEQDSATWFLMAGDEQVMLEVLPKPALFPDHFHEPTYIGRRADGSKPFTGRLERPQLYNEFYYLNDPWRVEREPGHLLQGMCK